MKAETEQKASPAVCACSSPAVDSGSGCIHQWSRGKASTGKGTKHYRAAGFLKQGNENLPLPELASPLLFTHSHGRVGKSSDTPFHSGFVSADRSPRFVLQFCVDVVSLNRELHNEECAVIYLHVALLTCHCNTWD